MPIEYSQFLKSYPTLKAAREAEANQSGEDKIPFTNVWKTVVKWVESQFPDEVLDSEVNPEIDVRRLNPDSGNPDTTSLLERVQAYHGGSSAQSADDPQQLPAGIISAPPTEANQKNLEILESLRTQGSFGNKVEPEVVNLAPVGQIVSQAPTSPDTSSNKDAKKQVLEIVAAMEQANIGKEVIRKELLRLLELIKPAEAESPYARALAEVYVEFTKESN
jgi:hypothetical protein